MASDDEVYFYVDGDDIGLVVQSTNTQGETIYGTIQTAATLKIWGRFQQDDLATDGSAATSSYSNINSRHHILIAYKALESLGVSPGFYRDKYERGLRNIKSEQFKLKRGTFMTQTDY